jgi:hypothetical protein
MSLSPDGKYLAFLAPSADQTLRDRVLRVVNIQTQRASWAAVPGIAGTMTRIAAPGMGANEYGPAAAWRTTQTIDHRRSQWTYQRTGGVSNDASRVAFTPNTSLSVAIEAAHTVTVQCDMDVWLKPFSAKPWIGGDRDRDGAGKGEGPSLYYTTASPNIIPIVDSGLGPVLTSPTASTTLTSSASDADGSIASYLWTQLTGAAATIATPAASSTLVSGLAVGAYSFRCTVTDNSGGVAHDDVAVTVVSPPITQYVPAGGGAFRGRLAAQPSLRGRLAPG